MLWLKRSLMEAVFPSKHLPVWIDCLHSAQAQQRSSYLSMHSHQTTEWFRQTHGTKHTQVLKRPQPHANKHGPRARMTRAVCTTDSHDGHQSVQTCCWTSGFTRQRGNKKRQLMMSVSVFRPQLDIFKTDYNMHHLKWHFCIIEMPL